MPLLNKFQYPVSLRYCLFNLLVLISHRGKSRTPKATKMGIFVSTINDSQPLIAVTKNFVLDATVS